MSTIPKFASNKKYWQILNKLVFGDEVSCPRCHAGLHENYCNWWAYDELELLGYAHESWNHSKGRFAGTNQGENIWSVTKRHARKLFGGRILTRQLDSLCLEWMARANQPELFASPIAFLRFTMAYGLVG